MSILFFSFLFSFFFFFFFFNDTATTEIYTLSLHDALPIWRPRASASARSCHIPRAPPRPPAPDRKSTRLNSSHVRIPYAVFCLKKKNKTPTAHGRQPRRPATRRRPCPPPPP